MLLVLSWYQSLEVPPAPFSHRENFYVPCPSHVTIFLFAIILPSSYMGEIPAETTTSNTPIRLDFASPFYLHPSESASSTLLSVVFDGTRYMSWRRVVLRALSVKSKTRFINGKVVRPNPTDPTFM
ncbi:hypothetical protein KY284_024817 [Solanum tuberosum]|nr:hypothetical protein KY284_024817 [Solanum tuberosum]